MDGDDLSVQSRRILSIAAEMVAQFPDPIQLRSVVDWSLPDGHVAKRFTTAIYGVNQKCRVELGWIYLFDMDCIVDAIRGTNPPHPFGKSDVEGFQAGVLDCFEHACRASDRLIAAFRECLTLSSVECDELHYPHREYARLWATFFLLDVRGKLEKYIKYHLAVIVARAMVQEDLPECPDFIPWHYRPGQIFAGGLHRRLWRRVWYRRRPADVQLALALYNCRKAAVAPV